MPIIHGIDPGPDKSAIVAFDGRKVHLARIMPNADLLSIARSASRDLPGHIYIEMIASYGMPVGREVFETCVFIGRLVEAFSPIATRLTYRKDVKIHLCGTVKAKDANVRQALIDIYGEPGSKLNQGPLYGIKSHLWAALAIAHYGITKL